MIAARTMLVMAMLQDTLTAPVAPHSRRSEGRDPPVRHCQARPAGRPIRRETPQYRGSRPSPGRRLVAGWFVWEPRRLPLPGEDRAAVDDRLLGAALHRAAVERRVLRFRAEPVGVDLPRDVGVEQHEIRGTAGNEPTDPQTENAGGVDRQPAQHLDQFEMMIVIELERQWQQRFKPDDAAGRRAE